MTDRMKRLISGITGLAAALVVIWVGRGGEAAFFAFVGAGMMATVATYIESRP